MEGNKDNYMTKKQNIFIIVFFLALIFSFTAGSLLKPDTGFSEKENRVLSSMPKATFSGIFDGTFSSEYETYLTDQFFWRNEWIGLKTNVERATGRQEINDVYFAKNGYLIEKHTGSFTTDTAKKNISYLAEFLEKQQSIYGTDHVKAMIVPNAVEILSKKLPAFAENTEEEEYLTELKTALPQNSLVNVEESLKENSEEYIYYRTDHHWTTKGAALAFNAWAEETGVSTKEDADYEQEILTEDFLGTIEAKVNCKVTADTIEAWIPKGITYTVTYNGDDSTTSDTLLERSYLETRDKYSVFFGGNQPLIEIQTNAGTGRTLLLLKDSYAHCFAPMLLDEFDRIVMVDLRYYNERLSDYMTENEFTDILVLYNASGFAEDTSIAKLAL